MSEPAGRVRGVAVQGVRRPLKKAACCVALGPRRSTYNPVRLAPRTLGRLASGLLERSDQIQQNRRKALL